MISMNSEDDRAEYIYPVIEISMMIKEIMFVDLVTRVEQAARGGAVMWQNYQLAVISKMP